VKEGWIEATFARITVIHNPNNDLLAASLHSLLASLLASSLTAGSGLQP